MAEDMAHRMKARHTEHAGGTVVKRMAEDRVHHKAHHTEAAVGTAVGASGRTAAGTEEHSAGREHAGWPGASRASPPELPVVACCCHKVRTVLFACLGQLSPDPPFLAYALGGLSLLFLDVAILVFPYCASSF